MTGPVIVAYDHARDDRAPVAFAQAVARRWEVPALAVSVVEAIRATGGVPDVGQLRAAETGLVRLQGDVGVDTRMVIDVSVARGVHRLAEEQRAQLIVVGSTHRGRPGRIWPGSTAERLLHGAPCPVALVPHAWEPRALREVAVAYVAGPEARSALAAGADIATGAGARLRVITVLPVRAGVEPLGADPAPLERTRRRTERQYRVLESDLVAAVAGLGRDAHPEVLLGDPAELLLDVAEHVDLLVCGSRGYGPLRSVLLGGVSRRVVDGAACPVLVLPRGVAVSGSDQPSSANAPAAPQPAAPAG